MNVLIACEESVSNWEEHINVNRAEIRSKTFTGIAKAMAEQWG